MTAKVIHVATGDQVFPREILGWETRAEVPTVVHRIIGVGAPDFTLQPAGPRTGTYQFLMLNEGNATTMANLLRRPGMFAVSGADAAMADLTFYVTGTIGYALDEETRTRVIVKADFTEVL